MSGTVKSNVIDLGEKRKEKEEAERKEIIDRLAKLQIDLAGWGDNAID